MVEHTAVDVNKPPPGHPSCASARQSSARPLAREHHRLIIYDDSAVFGGHEVMTLLALEGILAAGMAVQFFLAPENEKLRVALASICAQYGGLEIAEAPAPSRKWQGVRNHWEGRITSSLGERFREFRPDAVLCAQGNLEISSRGVLAAKRAGLPTISYIPLAHTQAEMGATLGALRDPFNRNLLNAPDAFITLSHDAASQLRKRGTRVPVEVVYNGIETGRFGGNRAGARGRFGLPQEGAIVALCGRLEVKQKGQLLLLEALSASAWLRSKVLALIVGDGPDEAMLQERVRQLRLQECVRFIGWCDTAALYPALDAVVIASRYEGMPLVMLEALASGVPVVSSRRDGMQEVLPSDWLYPPGNASALAGRLEWVLQNDVSQDQERLRERVRREMSVEVFREYFVRTVERYCEKMQ